MLLVPALTGITKRSDLAKLDLISLLKNYVGWDNMRELEAHAPVKFALPTGNGVTIDYSGGQPKISVRLQELLGCSVHPAIGGGKVPLLIELLSPAHRPIQTTSDLPKFWESSYADVRKDMRGRYPKHHWPEDPANAVPTSSAKRKNKNP